MSEGLLAVLIICMTALGVTAMICWLQYRLRATATADRIVDDMLGDIEDSRRVRPAPMPVYEYEYSRTEIPAPVPEAKPEPEPLQPDTAPMAVDPERPPYASVYNPRPLSTAVPPKCFCHKRPLTPGQKVLMWPVKGSEEVRIFCQREAA